MPGVAALLGVLSACATVSTLEGARPLTQRNQLQVAVGYSSGRGVLFDDVGTPRIDLSYRQRVSRDADLGLKLLGGTPAVDVRTRFAETGRTTGSFAPGMGGMYLPTGGFAFFGRTVTARAEVSVWAPLLVDVDVSRRSTLTFAARPIVRSAYAKVSGAETESVWTTDLIAAGGVRLAHRTSRIGIGVALDVEARPNRGGVGAGLLVDVFSVRRPD